MSVVSFISPGRFVDIVINPAYDLVHDVMTLVFQTNSTKYNVTSYQHSVDMTDDDMKLYFTLKLVFLLLPAIFKIFFALVIAYWAYVVLFVPYERVKRLGSIGYINHESGRVSKKDLANLIRKRRKLGEDLPPVYPNGWFRLLDSHQLKKEEVKEVTAIGEHFAVYRSKTGKVSVLDAYCPHMGGNLAVGGLVKGECLECPFHGWKFNGEGKCVDIPYSDKVPNFAKTKSWHSNEVNGGIYVWYHCDGKDPEWEIPVVEEIANGTYKYKGRVEHHINTHIQDIPENGSDQAHLSHLHVPSVMAGNDLSSQYTSWFNIGSHIFKAVCLGSTEDKPHISIFELVHYIEFMKKWQFIKLDFKVYQIGPGMVHLYFTSALWTGVFVQTLTPLEPLHQVLTHKLYSTWTIPTWLGRIFLFMEAIQVDRDVTIWNNKTYRPRPKLVKEDKLIAQYRRWFAQFYSENSPRLQMKAGDGIQW